MFLSEKQDALTSSQDKSCQLPLQDILEALAHSLRCHVERAHGVSSNGVCPQLQHNCVRVEGSIHLLQHSGERRSSPVNASTGSKECQWHGPGPSDPPGFLHSLLPPNS